MDYNKIDKIIKQFYGYGSRGNNFSDATYEYFKEDYREMLEIKDFLIKERILEKLGDAGKYNISKKGKNIWTKFGSIEKYLENCAAESAENEKLKQIEKQKLIHDSKISKWQAQTFWWVFFIGLVGGICGIISLIMQLT